MAKDYPFRDKSIVEDRFDYRGFPCVVIFRHLGFRCGYVGLPKDHPRACEGNLRSYEDLSAHGGITYAEDTLYEQPDTDRWWIGFDCGHYGDGTDYEATMRYFGNDDIVMKHLEIEKKYDSFDFPARDLEYVRNECKKLVDQIADGKE